jgi:cyclic pyranopterin phosphate synthase
LVDFGFRRLAKELLKRGQANWISRESGIAADSIMPLELHTQDPSSAGPPLSDRNGRTMKKLRVSLTDRCNLRCVYCMPECPGWRTRDEILGFEEIERLAEIFVARLGVEQVRLTGGEPLVRQNVADLMARLGALRAAGLRRLSLSTNGVLLARYARDLADAGLDDINVSLDSLSPWRFEEITGGGRLGDVLAGIERARTAGIAVKLNCVVLRGINDGDVLPLARWAYQENLALRFIEFMPLDSRGLWSPGKVFTEQEIIASLQQEFSVVPESRTTDPARYFTLNGRMRVGVISTVSSPFCAQCDRIRLTADGRLFPCLFSQSGIDLKGAMRAGSGADLIEACIRAAVANKPRGFVEQSGQLNTRVGMHVLGG